MRNEDMVMRTTSRNPAGGNKQSSSACIVPCDAGDQVSVRADNTDEGFVAVWGESISSFSGFIIHDAQVTYHILLLAPTRVFVAIQNKCSYSCVMLTIHVHIVTEMY